jgi:GPN-loop GTPase
VLLELGRGLRDAQLISDVLTAFNLDFYTEVKDLDYLVPLLEQDRRTRKFSQLNKVICEIIEDFGLVSFETLCVEVGPTLLPR